MTATVTSAIFSTCFFCYLEGNCCGILKSSYGSESMLSNSNFLEVDLDSKISVKNSIDSESWLSESVDTANGLVKSICKSRVVSVMAIMVHSK